MELATAFGTAKSGGLIVAAIAAVFTIGYVANMLGEDEDWLHDLSIDIFPENGCLHVYGVGEDRVTPFTDYGIECLRQIIADEKNGRQRSAPSQINGVAQPAVLTACLPTCTASGSTSCRIELSSSRAQQRVAVHAGRGVDREHDRAHALVGDRGQVQVRRDVPTIGRRQE